MARKALGFVLGAALVFVGVVSEAGVLKLGGIFRQTTLKKLVDSPELYKEVSVRFSARFKQAETDYQVFRTHFTSTDYAVFSVWPDDAQLWEAGERQKALPYLFVHKRGSVLPVIEKLAKYQTVVISGKVVAIYKDLPCIQVIGANAGPAPDLTEKKIKTFELAVAAVETNPKYVLDEFAKALAGKLPDVFVAGAKKYMGRSHFLRGEYAKAVECYTDATQTITDDAELLLWKGIAECKAETYDAAIETLTLCVAAAPGDGYAKSTLGVALAKKERFEEAIAQCAEGVKLSQRNGAVYWNSAEVLVAANRHREAAVVLEKALSLRRGDVEILKRLGDEYLVLKDVDKAGERFAEAVKRGPFDAEAHFGFARAYVAAGDSDHAKAEYLKAVELDPKNVHYHLTLADHHVSREEFLAAENRFKEVLKLEPDNVEAHFRIGLIAQRNGKWEDAKKSFERVVAIDPANELGYRHLTEACRALGDTQREIWAMEKIVELVPKDDETRFTLSQHYFEAQDFESAIAHLKVCTELQPKNANYHLGLAMALGEDGRTKEAEESYKTTLKLNPDDAAANNNLACIYLAAGRKDNEMFSLAKKAQSLDPQRSTFLDTLGWAYYVRGKNAEAREYIEASYKKEADPEVAYHYGCVMMDLGFLDDAERLLKESLNEESPGWKNDANKRLKRIELLRRQGARSKKRAAARAPKKLVKPESEKEAPKPAPRTPELKKAAPKKTAPKRGETTPENRLDAFKKRVSGEKKADEKKDEKKAEEKKEKRTRER